MDLVPFEFLRPPTSVIIQDYTNVRTTQRNFTKQYATTYNQRLLTLKPRLEEATKIKWPFARLTEIGSLYEHCHLTTEEQKGIRKVVLREDLSPVGTLFKCQPKKPTILDDFANEAKVCSTSSHSASKFISEFDSLKLEDLSSSVKLNLEPGCGLTCDTSINGLVCAMQGSISSDGTFVVTDVLFPTPSPPRALTKPKLEAEIVLISGIQLGKGDNPNLYMDLLLDYLEEQQSFTTAPFEPGRRNQIVTIILGNSFPEKTSTDEKSGPSTVEISKRLDEFFDRISKICVLVVLPGAVDPSSVMAPQPALHRCLFPRSSRRINFKLPSNPAKLKFPVSDTDESLNCFVSSGETITDAMRSCSITSSVEMCQRMIKCGIIFPNAPDTLPLCPGTDEVFLYDDISPDLYVVGNQPTFDFMHSRGTRIVSVPKFFESRSIIIVDKNLDIFPLKFNASL